MISAMDSITNERLDEAAAIIRGWRTPKSSAVFDFMLGNILYQKDAIDDAIDAYQAAVEKHPKYRRAWGNLAQLHYANAAFAEAKLALTRVIAIGGGDAVTFALLGVCHARGQDHIAAESAFRMAIMLEPDTVEYRMPLAETLFRQGRFAEAASLFEYLIELQPERTELWRFPR